MKTRLEELKNIYELKSPGLTKEQFLSDGYQLALTEQSKKLFAKGKPGQGYVGLVNLENGDIHLYPSFNRNDGLDRKDKHGGEFELEDGVKHFVESKDQLGARTGDLHEKAVSELGMLEVSGSRHKAMGFGLWKAGVSIKFLNALPPPIALVPHEVMLLKEKNEWQLYYTDDYATLHSGQIIYPAAQLLNKERLTETDRHAVEDILRDHYANKLQLPADDQIENDIKYIKNRSTSQNTHSCEYSSEYKNFFRNRVKQHEVHARDLERELPLDVFAKINTAIGSQLGSPACREFMTKDENGEITLNVIVPHKNDNIALHLYMEMDWSELISHIQQKMQGVDDKKYDNMVNLLFIFPELTKKVVDHVVESFQGHDITQEDINAFQQLFKSHLDDNARDLDDKEIALTNLLLKLKNNNSSKSFAGIINEVRKLNNNEPFDLQPRLTLFLDLMKAGLTELALKALKNMSQDEVRDAASSESIKNLNGFNREIITKMIHEAHPTLNIVWEIMGIELKDIINKSDANNKEGLVLIVKELPLINEVTVESTVLLFGNQEVSSDDAKMIGHFIRTIEPEFSNTQYAQEAAMKILSELKGQNPEKNHAEIVHELYKLNDHQYPDLEPRERLLELLHFYRLGDLTKKAIASTSLYNLKVTIDNIAQPDDRSAFGELVVKVKPNVEAEYTTYNSVLVRLSETNFMLSRAQIDSELSLLKSNKMPNLDQPEKLFLTLFEFDLIDLAKIAVSLTPIEDVNAVIARLNPLYSSSIRDFVNEIQSSNTQHSSLNASLEQLVSCIQSMHSHFNSMTQHSSSLEQKQSVQLDNMISAVTTIWQNKEISDPNDKLNKIVSILKENYEQVSMAYPIKLLMQQKPLQFQDALNDEQTKNHYPRFIALAMQRIYSDAALSSSLDDKNHLSKIEIAKLNEIKRPAIAAYDIFSPSTTKHAVISTNLR